MEQENSQIHLVALDYLMERLEFDRDCAKSDIKMYEENRSLYINADELIWGCKKLAAHLSQILAAMERRFPKI